MFYDYCLTQNQVKSGFTDYKDFVGLKLLKISPDRSGILFCVRELAWDKKDKAKSWKKLLETGLDLHTSDVYRSFTGVSTFII